VNIRYLKLTLNLNTVTLFISFVSTSISSTANRLYIGLFGIIMFPVIILATSVYIFSFLILGTIHDISNFISKATSQDIFIQSLYWNLPILVGTYISVFLVLHSRTIFLNKWYRIFQLKRITLLIPEYNKTNLRNISIINEKNRHTIYPPLVIKLLLNTDHHPTEYFILQYMIHLLGYVQKLFPRFFTSKHNNHPYLKLYNYTSYCLIFVGSDDWLFGFHQ